MKNEVSYTTSYSNYFNIVSILNSPKGEIDIMPNETELVKYSFKFYPTNTIGNYKINSFNLEINKSKLIMASLADYYSLDNIINDIDFLVENEKVFKLLPDLNHFINSNFNNVEDISLKLLKEDKDWRTLFIFVHSKNNWNEINEFTDKFYDFLFENYPEEEKYINISFVS